MQCSRFHFLVGWMLFVAMSSLSRAEKLLPDPAWQEGVLNNGLRWQVLVTPQRPGDKTEVRLLVKTGSLSESSRQVGYSQLLPKLAMLMPQLASALRVGQPKNQDAVSPVVTSYDYTLYKLSLPVNRPDALKNALDGLAAVAGNLRINAKMLHTATTSKLPIATEPASLQTAWWRYRLKGSSLLGHSPDAKIKRPVEVKPLRAFYKQWYTPDAMTLLISGNVDSRSLIEQINKSFSSLSGRRQTPASVPTLMPLPHKPVSLLNSAVEQDRLSLVWDMAWQPIQTSQQLIGYWQEDLAREALFWHLQRWLENKKREDIKTAFGCDVLYQRAQCTLSINSENAALPANMKFIARELANVRDNGLPQEEFDALVARKLAELNKLFAIYARMSTGELITQHLRSQQNEMVDIAPEQYQKLRHAFLLNLTRSALNERLRQQLMQEIALVLMQPPGEAESDVQALWADWLKIMPPSSAAAQEKQTASLPALSS